jgi:hypothetical protein
MARKGKRIMEQQAKTQLHDTKVSDRQSPVRVVISWLIEADREYRVAQSMVNETHNKL